MQQEGQQIEQNRNRIRANLRISLSQIIEKPNNFNKIDETQLIKNNKDTEKSIELQFDQLAQRLNLDKKILQNSNISFNLAEFDRQYTTLEKIGEGCIGVVKKVWHKETRLYYAIKTVTTTSEEILRNIIIEFISLLYLSHVNVVKVHYLFIDYNDSFMSESKAVLVMELVEGSEMFENITQMGHYTEANARDLFKQILSALQYLHEKNICHRDLKPHNILCTKDQKHIKITDFNVSKFLEPQQQFAVRDIQKLEMWTYTGTLAFSAPEMFLGQGYDYRVDIWSAGCILYTMLSGLLPFNGDYVHCLIDEITKKEIPFPHKQFQNVSNHAIDLIKKLLEKDPAKRINLRTAIIHPWFTQVRKKKKHFIPQDIMNYNLEGFSIKKTLPHLVSTKDSLIAYKVILSQVSSSNSVINNNNSDLSINFPRKINKCQPIRNRGYNYERTKSFRERPTSYQKYPGKPQISEDLKYFLSTQAYPPIVIQSSHNILFYQNS